MPIDLKPVETQPAMDPPMEFEIAVLYWIKQNLQFPTLDFLVLTFIDKNIFIWPTLATILAILYLQKSKGVYYLLTVAAAVLLNDGLVHHILKPLFARPRPCHELVFLNPIVHCSSSWAFPSSQTSNLFAFAAVTAGFFRRWGPFVFLAAALGGAAKLYQFVHYPSDVLIGMVVGTIMGVFIYKIAPKNWDITSDVLPLKSQNREIRRILLIRLSSLGDVVHTLPALRTLRRTFPDAHITWVVEDKFKDVLQGNPDLNEILVVRTRDWRRQRNLATLREMREFFRVLRGRNFDLAIDIQGLIKTGIIAALSGAPLKVGFDRRDCREQLNALFTNVKVPHVGRQTHVVEKNLSMIRALGAEAPSHEFVVHVPEEAEAKTRTFFDAHPELEQRPIVVLHSGVGYRTKQWELERFARLGDRISEELDAHILLTWGPGEQDKVQRLSSLMKHKHWVAPPSTLHQSMALFQKASLFVGGDTGTLHLCAAMDIPTVSLFGPTDPVYNGPFGSPHEVIVKKLHCSFCYKKTCPTQNECMDGITVDEVFEAVTTRMNGNARPVPSRNRNGIKVD